MCKERFCIERFGRPSATVTRETAPPVFQPLILLLLYLFVRHRFAIAAIDIVGLVSKRQYCGLVIADPHNVVVGHLSTCCYLSNRPRVFLEDDELSNAHFISLLKEQSHAVGMGKKGPSLIGLDQRAIS